MAGSLVEAVGDGRAGKARDDYLVEYEEYLFFTNVQQSLYEKLQSDLVCRNREEFTLSTRELIENCTERLDSRRPALTRTSLKFLEEVSKSCSPDCSARNFSGSLCS